jgi:hypothetical protein
MKHRNQGMGPKFKTKNEAADLKGLTVKNGQQINNRPQPQMGMADMMKKYKAGTYRGGY